MGLALNLFHAKKCELIFLMRKWRTSEFVWSLIVNIVNGTFLVGVVHPVNNTPKVIAATSIAGDTWKKMVILGGKFV